MESEDHEHDATAEHRRHLRVLLLGTSIAMVIMVTLLSATQPEVRDVGGFPGVSVTPEERSKQLYVGVRQRGAVLGSPRAPARMVAFIDLQCPACVTYSVGVLPALVNNYVRTEKVQLVLRPVSFVGPDSSKAARAAAAAAQQNRLWQFSDFFLLNQGRANSGYVTPGFLRKIAREAGAEPAGILANARSPMPSALLQRTGRELKRYRITAAPAFLMGRRGRPLKRVHIPYINVNEFAVRLNKLIRR
jgi:protein-disulfide isomerase